MSPSMTEDSLARSIAFSTLMQGSEQTPAGDDQPYEQRCANDCRDDPDTDFAGGRDQAHDNIGETRQYRAAKRRGNERSAGIAAAPRPDEMRRDQTTKTNGAGHGHG